MNLALREKLPGVEIHLAQSETDLFNLFRFRYEIYVEEMNRPQKWANYQARTIEEPLDHASSNFIAIKEGKIIGCIRSTLGTNSPFGEYEQLYGMRCVGPYFPRQCNVNTKLMIAPAYRRSLLMVSLVRTAYEHVRRAGIVCDFIDCNRHLERQFTRFGYRPYRSRVDHPEYGDVLPMLLCAVDLDHLERQRSPLAAVEQTLPRHPDVVRYFQEHVFKDAPSRFHDTWGHSESWIDYAVAGTEQ